MAQVLARLAERFCMNNASRFEIEFLPAGRLRTLRLVVRAASAAAAVASLSGGVVVSVAPWVRFP